MTLIHPSFYQQSKPPKKKRKSSNSSSTGKENQRGRSVSDVKSEVRFFSRWMDGLVGWMDG